VIFIRNKIVLEKDYQNVRWYPAKKGYERVDAIAGNSWRSKPKQADLRSCGEKKLTKRERDLMFMMISQNRYIKVMADHATFFVEFDTETV